MMKYLIKYLLLAICMYAVDDESGGSGGSDEGGEEGGQDSGKDGGGSEDTKQDTQQGGTKESEHVSVPKEQFEAMRRSVDAIENEKALNSIEANIKKSTPDFSIAAVTEYLRTLEKTDPEKAKKLAVTPEAWEAIYKSDIRQSAPQNDYIGKHRNEGKSEFDFDKTLAAANDGDARAFNTLFDNSVSTNYKK